MIKIATLSFALVAVLSLGFPQVAQAQQSYKLVCRGPLFNPIMRGPNANGWYMVTADFWGGTAGSNDFKPNPGTCTWEDRAFRPGEPTSFSFIGNKRDANMLYRRALDQPFQWYVFGYNAGDVMEITAVN